MSRQCKCYYTETRERWAHPGCFAFHDVLSVGIVRPDGQEFKAPDSEHPGYLKTVAKPSGQGLNYLGVGWTPAQDY